MGQRHFGRPLAMLVCLLVLPGCDRPDPPASQPAARTIASLVPASTDLLTAMGLGGRLVAVSNFEPARESTDRLPRVGDYRSVDWEQLSLIRPTVMVVQYHPDKMPAGLSQRAAELGIELLNVRIDRLEDVYAAMTALAGAAGEPAVGIEAAGRMRQHIDAVAQGSASRVPVPTLLCIGDDPLNVIGRGTFLDDVLTAAGGVNVVPAGNSYPTLDREQILQLDPRVVINLIPGGSAQVVDRAKAFWGQMAAVSAVREARVHYITDPDILLPGSRLGERAEEFAAIVAPGAGAASVPSDGAVSP